jgi:hypothetical protein
LTGPHLDNKNNLLAANINKTTSKTTAELNEKNNLNNVALTATTTTTATMITPSIENELVVDLSTPMKSLTDTTLQYSGTIPRNNGTLCKKVYL